jgi:hypothetical protein
MTPRSLLVHISMATVAAISLGFGSLSPALAAEKTTPLLASQVRAARL